MRLYGLILALVLTACSQKQESAPPTEVVIESAAQLSLISGNPDFGLVSGSKTVIFQIRNTGDAASEIPTPSLTGTLASSFSIIQSSGCTAALPKNGTCTVRVNFSSSGKSGGSYFANLKVGNSLNVALSASVASPPAAQYGIYDGATLLSSSLGLNFGNLTGSQTLQKILTIKNTGSVASPALSLNLTNNSFAISNSTCESKILQAGQSCTFKILFSTAGKSPQVYLSDLLFDSQVFPLTGAVTAPLANDDPNSGVIIETFVNNEPLTAEDLNLGILPNNQGIVKVLTFKNVGTATSQPMTAALSENGNFFIISNLCQDKILAPGASCSFRLVFSAISKNAGSYNVSLTFPGVELPVTGEVLPTAECSAGTHLEAPNCVADIQVCAISNGAGQKIWANGAYGACAPVSCNSGFDLVNNSCMNVCLSGEHRNPSSFACESNILSCVASIPNSAVANQVWQGSAYGSCALTSCNSGFDKVGNACLSSCAVAEHRNPSSQVCEANVISCTGDIANAANATKTWNGSAYGSCQVVACNASFHNDANSCVSDSRACVIANGQGQEIWNGSAYGTCQVQSCNASFHIASNECAADVIDCAAEIDHAAAASKTWNGSAYGACDLSACVSNFHEESNACLSDTRACVIAHGEGLETWMGSQYSACTAQSCDASFHLFSNACEADVIDCTASISNAAHATQTWDAPNQVYSACDLQTCGAAFHEEANACANDVQDCTADIAHATAATKTWNGSAYAACQVSACDSGYEVQANACTEVASDPYKLVVYNLDAGTVNISPTPVSTSSVADGTAYFFAPGTQVTITPVDTATKVFAAYSNGACENAAGACTVSLDNNEYVRIYFDNPTSKFKLIDINKKLKNACFIAGKDVQVGVSGDISEVDCNSSHQLQWMANYSCESINDGNLCDHLPGCASEMDWETGDFGYCYTNGSVLSGVCFDYSSYNAYPALAQADCVNNSVGDYGKSARTGDAQIGYSDEVQTLGKAFFNTTGLKSYFSADDGVHGQELWVTDGTRAGTKLVKDINSGSVGSYPSQFVELSGIVYFTAATLAEGGELWRTDGTDAGTYLVKDIVPGSSSSIPRLFVANSKIIIFPTVGNLYREVWASDGTAGGTSVIYGDRNSNAFNTGTTLFSYMPNFLATKNYVFFPGVQSASTGQELWRTDGTSAGTFLVKDISSGTSSGFSAIQNWPFVFDFNNNKIVFAAYTAATGIEPYISDGTTAGTNIIADFVSGTGSSQFKNFKPIGYGYNATRAYLSMGNGTTGIEPYQTTGTAINLPQDTYAGATSSDPTFYGVMGVGGINYMVYTAASAATGFEFYRSSNVIANPPVLISDLTAGANGSFSSNYFYQDVRKGFPIILDNMYFNLGGQTLYSLSRNTTGTTIQVNTIADQAAGYKYHLANAGERLIGAFSNVYEFTCQGCSYGLADNGAQKVGMGELFAYEPNMWSIYGFDGTTTTNSATLIWNTDGATTTTVVKIGLSETDLTYRTETFPEEGGNTHVKAITGLPANTPFWFQIIATDRYGRSASSVVIRKATKP